MIRLGLIIAALTVLLDQLAKWLIVEALATLPGGRSRVTSFFDLVLVHNRGISFGLFDTASSNVQWILGGIAVAVSVGLLYWLRRVERRWIGATIGLILGGAVGNVIDRARFGAVIDYLDFHIADYHWPAFNLADAAISVGVLMLFLDALLKPPKRPR